MSTAGDETMGQHPDADLPTGGYVHHPAYLEMRLRMLLTGTAAPSEEDWTSALKRLLGHLAAHPVPGTSEARTEAYAVPHAPPAPDAVPGRDTAREAERAVPALAEEIRLLDLDDDYVQLVMASDSPVVARLAGRVLDWSEHVPDSLVLLDTDSEGVVHFAVDVALHFEDPRSPSTETLTLFGSATAGSIRWSHADISARARGRADLAVLLSCVSDRVSTLTTADVLPRIEGDLKGEIERRSDALLSCDARLSDIVVTGDDGLLAFVAPGSMTIAGTDGSMVAGCLYHGTIGTDGTPRVLSVTTGLA